MVQTAGGEVPIIMVPPLDPSTLAYDLNWEYTSLAMGWWFADWNNAAPGSDPAQMQPGPQFSQDFQPPNYELADILLISGNPSWASYL
jgi:hypothetical protein